MPPLDRRDLLKGVVCGVAAAAVPRRSPAEPAASAELQRPWRIIDTNVSLFQWPFRRLPYDSVDELAAKLRSLEINQAWAGSYEGILQQDLRGVNARLAEACRNEGAKLLAPFGSVNPALPDWEEDLRHCHEVHRMPGIRLHPNYHGYTLEDPRFKTLLSMAAARKLMVQVAASMEDTRTQHPLMQVPDVDLTPLCDLMNEIPGAQVLILNYKPGGDVVRKLAATPRVYFDTARVEGTDGIARLVQSAGSRRVVFGTHAPFFIYESALIKAYESELAEVEYRRLFQQNAQRLVSADRASLAN